MKNLRLRRPHPIKHAPVNTLDIGPVLPDAESSRNMPVVFIADGNPPKAAASLETVSLSSMVLCVDRPDDRIA